MVLSLPVTHTRPQAPGAAEMPQKASPLPWGGGSHVSFRGGAQRGSFRFPWRLSVHAAGVVLGTSVLPSPSRRGGRSRHLPSSPAALPFLGLRDRPVPKEPIHLGRCSPARSRENEGSAGSRCGVKPHLFPGVGAALTLRACRPGVAGVCGGVTCARSPPGGPDAPAATRRSRGSGGGRLEDFPVP